MNEQRHLADSFMAYINTLSNIIQSSEHMLRAIDQSSLKNLTGEEIWELSSKRISLEQIKLDIEFMRKIL